ncbi:acyl-CoA carboxylase epsilon subunit [Streptomyces sp. NPDC059875]|uniref:acyl-CoA carboxylase epsilon subunit n=1 Tax=unclassified Streptomyces TaxID=2593676 RepID=UPI003668E1D2
MIKVVRGNPTPEELAAALAVVQARAAATAAASAGAGGPAVPEGWSDPSRIAREVRRRPGPRSWARSYWPA